jgi:Mitochondrial ribosomal protein (VAR1)
MKNEMPTNLYPVPGKKSNFPFLPFTGEKAKELKKIQTLKQINNPQFNINLNPIHLDLDSTVDGNKTYLTQKGYNSLKETLNKSQVKKTLASPVSLSKRRGAANLYPYLLNNINHISLSPFIGQKNGVLLKYQKLISYNFNSSNSTLISSIGDPSVGNNKDTYNSATTTFLNRREITNISELLYYFFKSIYCLISKPVYLHSSDKVIIQLFYYLCIPKKKVFKFFSIKYIKSFKNKWLKKKSQAFSIRKNNKLLYRGGGATHKFTGYLRNNKAKGDKLFIKWRVLKSISRLRSKSNFIRKMLFNLRKFNLSQVFKDKFFLITKILSHKFNKAVEFQLIRLHHPYHDSNILINLLSLNIRNKKKNARNAINKIYNKNQIKNVNGPNLTAPATINRAANAASIPAFLSGIYIKIGGRLMREPIIPRLTTKIYERGASSTGKVNYLDVATITKKNRKGSYTIKIKSGQNFFPNLPTKKRAVKFK